MKRMILFIVLISAVILVTLPLFRPGFFVSDDGGWMIIRLSAFYQSLREGQFPVRFLGRLNFGYGYPVANFLYPGFMYIGSLVHFLGVPFIDTVKVIFGGSILLGTLCTYLWLKKYFNHVASTIGAIGYAFAPYLLFDLYHRGSVGEVLALAWAAMGLYSIKAKKRWLFGLAVPLLILTHNTLALVFLVFFGAYITFLGLWREYIFMFGAGVGMGAFFWLPALYERKYVIFNSVAVANPREYFLTISNAVLLGFSGLLAVIVSFFNKKLAHREKIFFLVVYILTILLVIPISAPLWQVKAFSRFIQFPYRLVSLTVFIGSWFMAYTVNGYKKNTRLALSIIFIVSGLFSVWHQFRTITYIREPEGYYTTNEATTTVADEYMPAWVSKKPSVHAYERVLFYKGRGSIRDNLVNAQTVDISVDAAEDSIIQINTLYYPGWGATVDDTQVRIDYENPEDVMRIAIPAGKHHLVLAFRETISRFLADCVSLVSLGMYIVLLFI